jgi:aryl-alcohol dehydrogenase-like predicted oxidoreductase
MKGEKLMRYKLLGKSGLRVSELCLGTMTFGEEWGWGASRDESRKIFDAFVEAGGNFLDTANKYTEGTSEKLLGEFIRSDRGRFVVATKYTSAMRPGDPNGGGNHRKAMVEALEGSLRRLGTDYVDLYWLHAWDAMTPVEEVMRAFDDLVSAGKVLYIGISDAPAWIVSRANTLAELRGWTPFVGLQVEYSLAERAPERDLLPMARALDIGVTAWSPLAGGLLTGKYNQKDASKGEAAVKSRFEIAPGFSRISDRNLKIAEAVQRTAREMGASPAQVALNWTRRKNTLPILGGRKLSQIQDNLGCLKINLSDDQARNLDELSRIELGFPHDFLQNPTVRNIMFGGTDALTDNHRA